MGASPRGVRVQDALPLSRRSPCPVCPLVLAVFGCWSSALGLLGLACPGVPVVFGVLWCVGVVRRVGGLGRMARSGAAVLPMGRRRVVVVVCLGAGGHRTGARLGREVARGAFKPTFSRMAGYCHKWVMAVNR